MDNDVVFLHDKSSCGKSGYFTHENENSRQAVVYLNQVGIRMLNRTDIWFLVEKIK